LQKLRHGVLPAGTIYWLKYLDLWPAGLRHQRFLLIPATVGSKLKLNIMRHILTILFCFLCSWSYFQTQLDLNREGGESFQKADKELNEVYAKILSEYKSDTTFIKNLKSSQRIWITFRDAELKVKFPDPNPRTYGSVYPMCASMYLAQLTRERIATLQQWIDGIEEGDVCAGSVKMKK
jgi:uncharacterized protein YecT (DUF1311 family)